MKNLFLPILSGMIVILPANPIKAAPVWPGASVARLVSFADLDMTSSHDRDRLKNRIAFAAYTLCLVELPASPSPAIADPTCLRAAKKSALEQMDRAVSRANGDARLVATAR